VEFVDTAGRLVGKLTVLTGSGQFHIRNIRDGDREWIRDFISARWGSTIVVTRGVIHQTDGLPGFIAEGEGMRHGLITYRIDGTSCEIVTLDAGLERRGIGSALIEAVRAKALEARCLRLWLITTNDNTKAVRFYQNRGFRIVAVHENAVEASRKLKPEIPLVGFDGIPIRDEIEMEVTLDTVQGGSDFHR
jgi:GNAT superfamily N-acetyltransferase